jgi:hypothetical protein
VGWRTVLSVAALAGLLAGCGSSGGTGTGEEPAASGSDPGPTHVHGLGVNPRDGALFIATHTGLFRAEAAGGKAVRVADRHQDTMGFTVIGADRFLASGHPDLREDQPPLLGLIRSDDAGKTWRPVSLHGRADLHVLRAVGRRVYAFDGNSGELLISDTGGRSWVAHRPPAPLVDLVIDPDDADTVVAATDDALLSSRDAGRTWRRLDDRPGMLVWTPEHDLTLFRADGEIARSSDGGRTWASSGGLDDAAVAVAAAGRQLFAAAEDGTVRRSADGGRNWDVRAQP